MYVPANNDLETQFGVDKGDRQGAGENLVEDDDHELGCDMGGLDFAIMKIMPFVEEHHWSDLAHVYTRLAYTRDTG